MTDSPAPAAGPSSGGPSRSDATVLNKFVAEYLQSHGFDKVLEMFRQGIKDQDALEDKDGEGEVDGATPVGVGVSGRRGSAPGREAIFRAPGPVPIESTLKRNIPQAQAVAASTMSERITPEFEAQARYIIEQLQKKAEAQAALAGDDADIDDGQPQAGGTQESILDTSDRVEGYKRYRRWVDDGLELWKAELDGLSFPIFVHTFLELIHFGFNRTGKWSLTPHRLRASDSSVARNFFQGNREHHEALHASEISSLSSITSLSHIRLNPLSQRFLSEKYTVPMSRNSHDLLLQWLSGAGLDEEWESGLQTSNGRAKEAVKGIVFNRIDLSVSNSAMPLDKNTLAASSGLLSGLVPGAGSVEGFNSATTLKLGPAPMTDKLKEQVVRTIQDDDSGPNGANGPNGTTSPGGSASALPNGHPNGDANGDVDMTDAAQDSRGVSREPVVQGVKLEPDLERDTDRGDLISPEEAETLPPVPAVFRIADLKREVEAVRDKRKMIRLGPNLDESKPGSSSSSATLPSVVAFTVFDGGEGVSSVEFSHDSSLMAVGSPESSIRLWSLKGDKLKAKSIDPSGGDLVEDEGQPMRKLIGHSGPVYSLSFDPIYGSASSPQALLSSSQDGTVRLWSLDTYSNLVVYRGHGRDPVWDVEWGPMGVYFATASRDRTARLWSSDRVTPLRMYTGHLSDVNCVRFHPNSLYLATGSSDNSCRLWDVQRGACIRLFLGHSDAVTCMAISPDGRTLASAGLDSNIWLWDLGSSRPIKKMSAHRGPIHSLAWSAESSVLVSGGADSTVRIWDAKSAGGERTASMRAEGNGTGRGVNGDAVAGMERGGLPMSPGGAQWDEMNSTADLMTTLHTKRTPVLKTHYTPRNLCMVAGAFIPPSSAPPASQS